MLECCTKGRCSGSVEYQYGVYIVDTCSKSESRAGDIYYVFRVAVMLGVGE